MSASARSIAIGLTSATGADHPVRPIDPSRHSCDSVTTRPNVNGLEAGTRGEGHMEIKKVVVREEEAKNRERQTIEKRPTR